VEVLLKDATTGVVESQSYQASSLKSVNDASPNQLAPLILQSFGKDGNRDGTFESWNITVGLRLPAQTILHGVDLVAAFDYQTEGDVKMQMETLAHIHATNLHSLPVHTIKTVGSLDLVQIASLNEGVQSLGSKSVRGKYDDNIFDSLEGMTTERLMREYSTRNETTKYNLIGRPISLYG
jgi:hypothetical protein